MHFKDYELEEILQNKKAQLIKLNNENKEKDEALYKLAKENSYNALSNILKTLVNEYDKKQNHNDILSINLYYNETIKIINNVDTFILSAKKKPHFPVNKFCPI